MEEVSLGGIIFGAKKDRKQFGANPILKNCWKDSIGFFFGSSLSRLPFFLKLEDCTALVGGFG